MKRITMNGKANQHKIVHIACGSKRLRQTACRTTSAWQKISEQQKKV